MAGEHGYRRIVTHGSGTFGAFFGERTEHLVGFLKGHLEHLHVALAFLFRHGAQLSSIF